MLTFAAVGVHGRELSAQLAMCAVLLFAVAAPPLAAQRVSPFTDLAPELASKIAAALPAGSQITLTVAAALSPDDAGALQVSLASLLTARGLRIVDAASIGGPDKVRPTSVSISVSCAENLRERACVADLRADQGDQIVAATRPREAASAGTRAPSLTLELRPLFSQEGQIVDAAVIDRRLLVLEPARATLYEQGDRGWQSRASAAIAPRMPPRDIRGRLLVAGDRVEILLPGLSCDGPWNSLKLECAGAANRWPLGIQNLGLVSGRNYFSTPEGLMFYGAAPLDSGVGSAAAWVVADRDGRLAILDSNRTRLADAGAADDVVVLRAPCGAGTYIVAASHRPNGGDVLRLLELDGKELKPVAPDVLLPGALTALWPTADPATATAITHLQDAGRYDAFHASIACGR